MNAAQFRVLRFLASGQIEATIPDKRNSRLQNYRLTLPLDQ